MPIIEANCIERVVVTSNISSMPEVAENAACLVDPYSVNSIREGFEKVISNDFYRDNLISNGRANKIRFDANKIAFLYLDVYKQLS